MEDKRDNYLLIPPILMWALVLVNYIFGIVLVFPVAGSATSLFLLGAALATGLLTWLLFLSDILSSRIYNRTFWLVVTVVTPLAAYPFYLFQKKRLLRIETRRGRFQPQG